MNCDICTFVARDKQHLDEHRRAMHSRETMEKVNHPHHYGGDSTYEHIKVVEAWGLDYDLGNCTKYIARAGKKTDDPLEDLKKARWYLDHKIQKLEADRGKL
jgi:hypothetical protein